MGKGFLLIQEILTTKDDIMSINKCINTQQKVLEHLQQLLALFNEICLKIVSLAGLLYKCPFALYVG